MEDDFKIWKVEYFSNNWSDLNQYLNLSFGNQSEVFGGFKSNTKKSSKGHVRVTKMLRKRLRTHIHSKFHVLLCSAKLVFHFLKRFYDLIAYRQEDTVINVQENASRHELMVNLLLAWVWEWGCGEQRKSM